METSYVKSAAGELKHVLLCKPTYLNLSPINKIAEDWLDKGEQIDQQKCLSEHQSFINIYRDNGVEVDVLEPTEGLKSQVFARDFEWLLTQDISAFHQYSFASLRQYGACFELVETYLNWLKGQGVLQLDDAILSFSSISSSAKAFQFQLARSVARKKAIDMEPIDNMATAWRIGMSELIDSFS